VDLSVFDPHGHDCTEKEIAAATPYQQISVERTDVPAEQPSESFAPNRSASHYSIAHSTKEIP